MSRTRALLGGFGLVLAALAGCRDLAPSQSMAPRNSLRGLLTDSLLHTAGLVRCTPVPYDSVTETIGPLGGTLQVGPHTLAVPAGALVLPTDITAVVPSDTVNEVRFQPQGLVFLQPASLTMSYANCDLLGVLLPKNIVYVGDSLEILDVLRSIDVLQGTVTAPVSHFSGYAVAW